MTGHVLIVDDDQAMCELLEDDLTQRGCDVRWYTDAESAFAAFCEEDFDTVVTDLKMPGLDGLAFCRRMADNRPDVPVIVITGFGSLDAAVSAIRAGAYDFVTKPIKPDMLAIAIQRALDHRALRQQVRLLQEQGASSQGFDEFVGSSQPMQRLFDQLRRLADQPVPVLVTGESGTGKNWWRGPCTATAIGGRADL